MGFSCSECTASFTKYCFISLSALSCLFFAIGAMGYNHEEDTIKNIPWFYVIDTYLTGDKVYFSLDAVYFQYTDYVGGYHNSSDKNVSACEDDGYSAYVLAVIACICSLSCTCLCGALIKNDFTFGQFIGCGLAGLATFFSGIALAVFMGDCQKNMQSSNLLPTGRFEYHWGSGSILTATGMVMMFCVSLGMFVTAKFCSSTADGNGTKRPDEPMSRMSGV